MFRYSQEYCRIFIFFSYRKGHVYDAIKQNRFNSYVMQHNEKWLNDFNSQFNFWYSELKIRCALILTTFNLIHSF